uniref:Protein transport protein Sec24C n=1 Tax=Panagrolaimus superbus TaxID=310955 RepID=A0A914Z9F9_9BILA
MQVPASGQWNQPPQQGIPGNPNQVPSTATHNSWNPNPQPPMSTAWNQIPQSAAPATWSQAPQHTTAAAPQTHNSQPLMPVNQNKLPQPPMPAPQNQAPVSSTSGNFNSGLSHGMPQHQSQAPQHPLQSQPNQPPTSTFPGANINSAASAGIPNQNQAFPSGPPGLNPSNPASLPGQPGMPPAWNHAPQPGGPNGPSGMNPSAPPGMNPPGIQSPGMPNSWNQAPQSGMQAPWNQPSQPGMPGAPGGMNPAMPPGMQPPGMQPPGMQPSGMQPPGMQPPGMQAPWNQASQPGMPPGPGSPPGMPGGWNQSAPPPQRLDPNSLPSAIQVIEDDRQTRTGVFPTGYPTAEHPPLVSTDFVANDYGNSNPKFMRSSFYSVPATQEFTKQSQIPFCISTTPFAKLVPGEVEPPVVDLGELGPVRCQRCKAYICPFMEFVDGGRKFRCPFCHTSSQVEETYFAHLDHTGRRTDIQYRQELYLGSYEFIATKLYCKNSVPPKQPAFIFFLDVSYNAVRSGLVDIFCKQLPFLLKNLPKDYNQERSSMRIGFATYDQTLHFYNLSNPHRAEMLIANDVSDVFVPFVEGFLVNFFDAEEAIKLCLEQVRTCFADTRITETMLGPVIQAGMDALRSADCAGKIFVFHTSIPTFEAPGSLKNREDRKVLGSDKEKVQLLPGTEFYTKLGEECIKIGCAVDIFLFPNSYLDIASIAPVSNISGGSIYKYQYFDAERDGQRFLEDLQHDISRAVAFDVMMRVRTSTGIRPTGFYGHFFMQNTTDIEFGALDADKNVVVECKYDDKLDEKVPAVFQTAVLFTSCGGQRRLRIHNISLQVTNDYNAIYRFADQDTIVTYLLKHAAKLIREKTPKEMKDELYQRGAQILATYREKCSQQSPHTQLVLPECLKLLPLYLSCIVRTDALNGGSELNVDDRVWLLQLIPSMRTDICMRNLYPQILPITNLEIAENNSQLIMPTPIRASYDYMNSNEVYFIENGIVGFIWIGLGAPIQFINDVFNAQSIQHLDTESQVLPERDNDRNRAVRKLISNVNASRPLRLKIFIIKQQDSLESWMKKFLVEDKYAANTVSYVDFLCQLHRQIRGLLS